MLNDIYLSIYSFGYSANFIRDDRRGKNFNFITPGNNFNFRKVFFKLFYIAIMSTKKVLRANLC